MDPRIAAISGALKGREYRLDGDRLTIGRETSNVIAPPDSAVSRQHCIVEWKDGQAHLTDLDSHNGTFVNGIPVGRRILMPGDVLRIGHSDFVYLTEKDTPSGSGQSIYCDENPSDILKTVKLHDAGAWLPSPSDIGRMARDLNALVKISTMVNSIQDAVELQRTLLECVFEVIPAEAGAILLLEQPEDEPAATATRTRNAEGPSPVAVPRELVQRALWEQSIVIAESPADGEANRNAICVPLKAVNRTVGVLYLASQGKQKQFGEDHVQFLNCAAGIAAVALENLLTMESLKEENRRLRAELNPIEGMVGDGKSMQHLVALIQRVAPGDSTVLIRGESGTGKEVVARAIHAASRRIDKPFVAINCAAIPDALLESELFGHERGAFTGAVATKKGKLEVAEDGTVLLDEIGELAPTMQAKLLRVLQEREFERVGGTRPLKLHARVLAATNRDLEAAIKEGEFRQDLFFRLNVVSLAVPPLRKHREDIPLLAIYFATHYAAKCNRPFRGITAEARSLLMNYDWPGNIRELENAIEHAVVLGTSDEIRPEDLPEALSERPAAASEGARYHAAITELKKRLIRDALAEARGSYTEAAKLLGVHPNYLHRLIRNLEMKAELKDIADD
jgi:Nif-specific regulatory protein